MAESLRQQETLPYDRLRGLAQLLFQATAVAASLLISETAELRVTGSDASPRTPPPPPLPQRTLERAVSADPCTTSRTEIRRKWRNSHRRDLVQGTKQPISVQSFVFPFRWTSVSCLPPWTVHIEAWPPMPTTCTIILVTKCMQVIRTRAYR